VVGQGVRRAGRDGSWVLHGFFHGVAWAERRLQDNYLAVVTIMAGLLALEAVMWFGPHPSGWDWVGLSAWIVLLVCLPVGLSLPSQADRAIQRLATRGVLVEPGDKLQDRIARSAEKYSRILGPATAIVLFVAYSLVWGPGHRALFVGSAIVAAFLTGRVVGRAIAIGTLGRKVEDGKWTLQLQPGHIDGAAGLKPIGDLYFRQAAILGIPAAWLALMLILRGFDMAGWGRYYFGLLVAAVAAEIAAFVVPMLSFHRVLRREKRKLLLEADRYGEQLHELEMELPAMADEARRQATVQITGPRERILRIEHLPTWPIDATIRRRFTIGNGLLLLPIVGNMLGATLPGTELWNELGRLFGEG
jgi:hypothetical protein